MKKIPFLILLILLSITLTGCGELPTYESIPEDLQGLYQGDLFNDYLLKQYYVYKLEGTTLKQKICIIDHNSGVTDKPQTYTIKDIEKFINDDEDKNVKFNLYDNDELYAKCYTTFGKLNCTFNDGSNDSWSKQA